VLCTTPISIVRQQAKRLGNIYSLSL